MATDPKGDEASIVCDWSDDLLKSLLSSYKDAKDAESTEIMMFQDPVSKDPNRWMLAWGNGQTVLDAQQMAARKKKDPIRYIS